MSLQQYNPNPEGRILRKDITFETGSYQTPGLFTFNPFDIAYRSQTKEQYYIDFSAAAGTVLTGTAGRLVRIIAKGLDVVLEGDPEQD